MESIGSGCDGDDARHTTSEWDGGQAGIAASRGSIRQVYMPGATPPLPGGGSSVGRTPAGAGMGHLLGGDGGEDDGDGGAGIYGERAQRGRWR